MMPLLVVDADPVAGTDTHTVSGNATAPNGATVPFAGTGRYDYAGTFTDDLSDLVRIGGAPLALTSSASSLDPGEDSAGGHYGPNGSSVLPDPTPNVLVTPSLRITDAIGTGAPGSDAGSAFVRVNGDAVLLDGDPVDSCDGLGGTANSTVTASGQDFVQASD